MSETTGVHPLPDEDTGQLVGTDSNGRPVQAANNPDTGTDLPSAPATTPGRPRRIVSAVWKSDFPLYLYSLVVTAAVLTWVMRLWRATLSAPFYYSGDAVASAAYFKDVIQVGWYENQPNLGAPYGQHYHDFPFADDLNPAMAKVISLFTSNWAVAFNSYYLLGFLLAALTAVWFFRFCGVGSWMAVVLSVLYAVTPYHFIRNENHLFLASYYCIPLAMVLVVRATRGDGLWARRRGVNPVLSVLTGRGAGSILILALVVYSGAYYGLFTAFLLAFGGMFALLRKWSWRRLFGLACAGGTVLFFFVLAMLPDSLYERANGIDTAGLVRARTAAEQYALKFASLVLPAPGHPIPLFAKARFLYDSKYPLSSERPVLGLMAAIGFVLLLGVAFLALTGRAAPSRRTTRQDARRATLFSLSFLTWIAFCVGTIGGLGTIVSFFTASIRGWNRISIVIVLFGLAGLGLMLDGLGERLAARVRSRPAAVDSGSGPAGRRPARIAGAVVPVIAVVVLLMGSADQSITGAVPPYAQNKAGSTSDQQYVDDLQARLPAKSMIFILPWQPFPESGRLNGLPESDQMKLWLHSTTLRWSGGGIKGRPQTAWPGKVVRETPAQMAHDLAVIGFVGISIHRAALVDKGKKWEASLAPLLGPPTLISPDKQYSYIPLTRAIDELDRTTTASQRAAFAAAITEIQQ